MKKFLFLLILGLGYLAYSGQLTSYLPAWLSLPPLSALQLPGSTSTAADQTLAQAFAQHQSNIHVSGHGTVLRVLPDDTTGSRHQKFILQLASGQTILVAHNIDLAPRIPALAQGDSVGFSGEYEWNDKGGVVHWTHRDPQGKHPGGWLEHQGKKYH